MLNESLDWKNIRNYTTEVFNIVSDVICLKKMLFLVPTLRSTLGVLAERKFQFIIQISN
jgi:hypothetical protein